MESFFYAVLGLCGVLLGLQALSSALRILKQDRANRLEQTDQESVQTNSVSRVNGRVPGRPWIPYVQSLSGRMVATFTCIVAALGLVTIAMVYFTVKSSLRYHAIERARVTAINVSDSAAGYVLKKNLKGMLTKGAGAAVPMSRNSSVSLSCTPTASAPASTYAASRS